MISRPREAVGLEDVRSVAFPEDFSSFFHDIFRKIPARAVSVHSHLLMLFSLKGIHSRASLMYIPPESDASPGPKEAKHYPPHDLYLTLCRSGVSNEAELSALAKYAQMVVCHEMLSY